MTTLREAAQQALEALVLWATGRDIDAVALNDLIFRLEAALAEDAMQRLTDVQQEIMESEIKVDKAEPVAWYHVPYPNSGISPMVSLSQYHEPSMYGAVVPLYLKEQL